MDELKRGGFVFYHSYYEAMEEMAEDVRGHFMNALVKYAFFDEMPEFEDVSERVAFKLIKATLDSSNNRYAACVENGKKGGAPKGNTNAKKKTTRETTKEQAKNNQRNNQTFNQTNNLKTTLMKNNMNMSMNTNMNNSDSTNPHSKDRFPLDAETPLQESGDYISDYQVWRHRQMSDYGITSVGGDCYQTTIGGECIIIDDDDFRRAFESGQNVNDYVAEKEGM
jgi:hypothetical protein